MKHYTYNILIYYHIIGKQLFRKDISDEKKNLCLQ